KSRRRPTQSPYNRRSLTTVASRIRRKFDGIPPHWRAPVAAPARRSGFVHLRAFPHGSEGAPHAPITPAHNLFVHVGHWDCADSRTEREHGDGQNISRRRSVFAETERAVGRCVHRQSVPTAREFERLPFGQSAGVTCRQGDRRRVGRVVHIHQLRADVVQHTRPWLPAGQQSRGPRLTSAWADGGW